MRHSQDGKTVQFRNTDGTPVDPVPFFVSILLAFLVTHAWGPLYFLALGLTLTESFAVVTSLWFAVVVVAFRQLIWEYRPAQRKHVPVELRLKKLLYGLVGGVLLIFLLALPLYL